MFCCEDCPYYKECLNHKVGCCSKCPHYNECYDVKEGYNSEGYDMAKPRSKKEKRERAIRIVAAVVAVFFLLSIFIIWGMYFIGR